MKHKKKAIKKRTGKEKMKRGREVEDDFTHLAGTIPTGQGLKAGFFRINGYCMGECQKVYFKIRFLREAQDRRGVKAFELKKGLIRERFTGRLDLGLGSGLDMGGICFEVFTQVQFLII